MKGFFRAVTALILIAVAVISLCFGYGFLTKALYPMKYESVVNKASDAYNVEKALIYSVIRTESGFRENAVSRADAIGLMQLVPETFLWLQDENQSLPKATVEELKTPDVNITYGTFYLSYLLQKYESKSTAIAAYNAGPGNVNKWLDNPEYSKDGVTLQKIPYEETRNYVSKVIAGEEMYNKLYFDEE